MKLLELLGRRWVLRLLWELREESLAFREVQKRGGEISPTIVSRRLNELCAAAIIFRNQRGEYKLTEMGIDLVKTLLPLHLWAEKWAVLRK
jgi:DNA-binding HxlR family transcriptional regulator